MDRREGHPLKTPEVTSCSVLLARCFWFFVGPAILVLLAVGIVSSGSGWVTALDVAFFLVLSLMLAGRWFEFQSGQAMTGTGAVASWADFRRYVLLLTPLAASVWMAANLLGNHLLGGVPDGS